MSNIDCGACPNITDGCHDVCQKSAQKKSTPVRRWGANWHMEMMYEMHNGPYVRSADFNIERRDRKAAQSELAALREELAEIKESLSYRGSLLGRTEQRLTTAEQRNADCIALLRRSTSAEGQDHKTWWNDRALILQAALTKPTESGASE